MSTAFSRTARALAHAGFRGSFVALTLAVLLLAVWGRWCVGGPVRRGGGASPARVAWYPRVPAEHVRGLGRGVAACGGQPADGGGAFEVGGWGVAAGAGVAGK